MVSNNKLFFSFLAGAAAACVAIFLSDKKNREKLSSDIKEKASQLRDSLDEKLNQMKDSNSSKI